LTLSRDSGEWPGKVVHIEHLGADTNVYLDTEKAGTVTVRLFGEVYYDAGATLWISPAEQRFVYRFDSEGKVIR
jgi:multiple sugar transport system ATP-binding protein